MGDLPEDSESSARVVVADAGAEQQDRPKLVALPEPEPAAEPDPARAAAAAAAVSADADRLALERSLSGPPMSGPRITGASSPAPAHDPAARTPAPSAAPWAPQPHGIADTIAVTDTPAITATPELVQALRVELAMRAHAEAGLRARAVDAETRLAARVLLSQRTTEALGQVREELEQLAGLLTEERVRRQAAEQRVAELEQQLAAGRGRAGDAAAEIAALRESLLALRTPAEDRESRGDAPPDAAAEVRADRLSDALTRLRAGTEPIDPAPVPVPVPVPVPAGTVAPAALTPATAGVAAAALTPATAGVAAAAPARVTAGVAAAAAALRPATAGVAAAGRRATLGGPFRTLCRRDPALAGQLALSLLPMQRIAHPRPVSYDILLDPGQGCVQVTSGDGGTEVARQATARPLQQVDFHLVGAPERFAKLLAAGRIRRRLGFGVARVRGHRGGLAALDALLALPLDLPALVECGMSTDPSILLSLVAAIVTPDWTRGERFSISHRDGDAPPTYLLIADGQRPAVTTIAPTDPIATVISCAQSDLASVLTGSPALHPAAVQVVGDPVPLTRLRAWIKRAQSE